MRDSETPLPSVGVEWCRGFLCTYRDDYESR